VERKNCWEVMGCERQPGGRNAERLGVCPAAVPGQHDGVNKGKHGGRICWAVSGTLCGGEVQGTYAKKLMSCLNCKFLKQVNEEEGRDFILTPDSPKHGTKQSP